MSKTQEENTEPKTWLTAPMIEHLKEHQFDGTWEEVAKGFNKKFGEKRSVEAIRIAFGRNKHRDLTGANFEYWQRSAFDDETQFKLDKGRLFVSGLMPLHTINKDGYEYTYNHVNMDGFRTVLHQYNTIEQRPVILPMLAHTQPMQRQPSIYDPALTPWKDWITNEASFNRNLVALDMRIQPQRRHPLTSMELADLENSIVLATPRQDLKVVATGNSTAPRIIRGSGVLNYPGYQPNSVGRLAEKAHRMGGLILELDQGLFHQRPVRFDENGGYYDLGSYVHYEGTSNTRAEALIFGDFHFEWTTEGLMRVAKEAIKLTRPKRIFFHDPADMPWCNPHIKPAARALMPSWMLSATACRDVVRRRMQELLEVCPADTEILWVDSNHGAGEGDFLVKWVMDRKYTSDPDADNERLGHILRLAQLDGKNVTAEYLQLPRVRYLVSDDDYFVKGWQCANHGHKGKAGARGRLMVKQTAAKLITAHSHEPHEEDNHIVIGHMSQEDHIYNRGGGRNWLQSFALIHPDGHGQQILVIKKPNTKDSYSFHLEA